MNVFLHLCFTEGEGLEPTVWNSAGWRALCTWPLT